MSIGSSEDSSVLPRGGGLLRHASGAQGTAPTNAGINSLELPNGFEADVGDRSAPLHSPYTSEQAIELCQACRRIDDWIEEQVNILIEFTQDIGGEADSLLVLGGVTSQVQDDCQTCLIYPPEERYTMANSIHLHMFGIDRIFTDKGSNVILPRGILVEQEDTQTVFPLEFEGADNPVVNLGPRFRHDGSTTNPFSIFANEGAQTRPIYDGEGLHRGNQQLQRTRLNILLEIYISENFRTPKPSPLPRLRQPDAPWRSFSETREVYPIEKKAKHYSKDFFDIFTKQLVTNSHLDTPGRSFWDINPVYQTAGFVENAAHWYELSGDGRAMLVKMRLPRVEIENVDDHTLKVGDLVSFTASHIPEASMDKENENYGEELDTSLREETTTTATHEHDTSVSAPQETEPFPSFDPALTRRSTVDGSFAGGMSKPKASDENHSPNKMEAEADELSPSGISARTQDSQSAHTDPDTSKKGKEPMRATGIHSANWRSRSPSPQKIDTPVNDAAFTAPSWTTSHNAATNANSDGKRKENYTSQATQMETVSVHESIPIGRPFWKFDPNSTPRLRLITPTVGMVIAPPAPPPPKPIASSKDFWKALPAGQVEKRAEPGRAHTKPDPEAKPVLSPSNTNVLLANDWPDLDAGQGSKPIEPHPTYASSVSGGKSATRPSKPNVLLENDWPLLKRNPSVSEPPLWL
ncbi:hypothetical protein EJ08DRAFT_698397 [Tothia fuscella]|uniref:Uncharacterized protein n=1 Tax=Tothia fuscella TaxID=1048955 RepID=A0A9P4NPH2_9PEZI|nr:hypothetical protein EJ08DRAFT_698397 [Tothia fuscella]